MLEGKLPACSSIGSFVHFGIVSSDFLISVRAYAPGEYKVLVSSDGGNFEEAACWRSSSRSEVSYKEMVLFKDVRTAKALAIVMKAPMPWSYFGLNDVSLLTEGDEAFMIVRSGASSHGLEECLVASGHEISAQACLDAIASGDGREVFKFQGADLMHSASGLCVAYAPGASNQVALQNCGVAARAQDGRASWGLTAEGQMKLTRMGNYCLNVVAGRASADDCGSSSEKFVLAVVPEFDLSAAGIAQDQATLLAAATKRQRRALNALQLQIPSLGGCKFAVSSFASQTNVTKLTFTHSVGLDLHAMQKSNGRGETAVAAVGRIYSAMGVDMADVVQLIGDSSKALEAVEAKLMHSA